jgi:hypothetical protein
MVLVTRSMQLRGRLLGFVLAAVTTACARNGGNVVTPDAASPRDGSDCLEYEGHEYCAPFVFSTDDAAGITINGLANMDAVASRLPADVVPVSVTGTIAPRALLSMSSINYRQSAIGPYREFALQVLVQQSGSTQVYYESLAAFLAHTPSGDSSVTHGFFMLRLTLDGEAAAEAIGIGRALGRFPKFPGSVQLSTDTWPRLSFAVDQPPGETDAYSVSATLLATTLVPIWVTSSTSVPISTPGTDRPCWMSTTMDGRISSELFDLTDDFHATGWLGTLLSDVGFVPAGWARSEATGTLTLDALRPECFAR